MPQIKLYFDIPANNIGVRFAERFQHASDAEADPITSGFTKCLVMLGLSDEAEARAGYPAFDYGDKEVELLCKFWHEAYSRAKGGVPLFRQLFERS